MNAAQGKVRNKQTRLIFDHWTLKRQWAEANRRVIRAVDKTTFVQDKDKFKESKEVRLQILKFTQIMFSAKMKMKSMNLHEAPFTPAYFNLFTPTVSTALLFIVAHHMNLLALL